MNLVSFEKAFASVGPLHGMGMMNQMLTGLLDSLCLFCLYAISKLDGLDCVAKLNPAMMGILWGQGEFPVQSAIQRVAH